MMFAQQWFGYDGLSGLARLRHNYVIINRFRSQQKLLHCFKILSANYFLPSKAHFKVNECKNCAIKIPTKMAANVGPLC